MAESNRNITSIDLRIVDTLGIFPNLFKINKIIQLIIKVI
jgi:hypothetical protein